MNYSHILSYIGGKFYIADWVISHFPRHICYVEVFGGAGHVLLRKQKSKVEVYNDINDDLVNLFRVAKEHPVELFNEVDALPYSRSLYETWLKEWKNGFKGLSDLEWATKYFYLSNCAFSGGINKGFATGVSRDTPLDYYNGCTRIHNFTRRMKQVIIEHLEYDELIKRYDSPNTCFYIDPPYINTEHYYTGYRLFTIDDHVRLATILQSIQGTALVSYYPCELVDSLYPGWLQYTTQVTKHSAGIVENSADGFVRPKAIELLLCNRKHIRQISDYTEVLYANP